MQRVGRCKRGKEAQQQPCAVPVARCNCRIEVLAGKLYQCSCKVWVICIQEPCT